MTCAVHRPGWLLRILRFLTGPDTKLTFAENLLLVAMKKKANKKAGGYEWQNC
jgi:hypothetical protein